MRNLTVVQLNSDVDVITLEASNSSMDYSLSLSQKEAQKLAMLLMGEAAFAKKFTAHFTGKRKMSEAEITRHSYKNKSITIGG